MESRTFGRPIPGPILLTRHVSLEEYPHLRIDVVVRINRADLAAAEEFARAGGCSADALAHRCVSAAAGAVFLEVNRG